MLPTIHFKISGDPKSIAQRPKSEYINHVSGQFSSMGLKHGRQTREYKVCLGGLKEDF
jgi:hypothetical protein